MRFAPAVSALFVLVLLAPAFTRPPAAEARPSRWESVLAPADSLALAGRPERAAAYADSLLLLAQARGDRALEAVVASRRVLNWISAGRLDDGAREAERVAALARAVRDTLSWGRALLAAGRAQLFRDRLAEAAPPYRELLPLARAVRDPLLEGNARLGLAYLDLSANRAERAETGYRRAVALLQKTRDIRAEMAARVGLARALRSRGRMDEARRSYGAIIERSRAIGDRMSEADAWNNLGEIEAAQGEPGRAAEDFARAVQLARAMRRPKQNETRNLAIMLVEAGRVDAAADTLERELARWPRTAVRETYALRTQLAVVKGLQGLRADCERILREQWALRDSVALDPATDAGLRLAALLEDSGRLAESRALALEMDRIAGGRLTPVTEVARVLQLSEVELRTGRVSESLERVRRLRASPSFAASGGWRERLDLELMLSRAFHAAGESDSAIAAVRRAGEAWERTASGVRDAEWYEPIGNSAARISIQTARVLLDPRRGLTEARRAGEAFDALQRFKSRALEWRTSGPAAAPALATAATLRQRVLRPGELLLDSYSSALDSSVVFAVDRGGIRAHWLAGGEETASGLLRSLAVLKSSDAASAPYRAAAARRLAADAFGPALEKVLPARRVFCSLSGLLNAIPLAALPADTTSDVPMLEGRTIVAVPSASWLARARQAARPALARARVVTIARTRDDRDRELDGVRDEARWMRGRYGAAGIVHEGDRPLQAVLPWLAGGDILHVASHARANSRDPWGSAFLLGRGDGEDAWLTARAIAARRSGARLAVLASCRTTLDGGFSNESVSGLSRAFLAAGVPAVVATMWPVDDRATAAFTRRFYLGLEQGRTAAGALREAQLATRRSAETAAPHFWAGFVLSGDPDTRATPLRDR